MSEGWVAHLESLNDAENEACVCDYCDEGLSVVCGKCSYRAEDVNHSRGWIVMKIGPYSHPFMPVHLIPDPEGIEGTQRVPCPKPAP